MAVFLCICFLFHLLKKCENSDSLNYLPSELKFCHDFILGVFFFFFLAIAIMSLSL